MLRYICMIAALVLAPGTLAHAITLGQTNDFQDRTTQGWSGYATAGNVSTGGPAGSAVTMHSWGLVTSAGDFVDGPGETRKIDVGVGLPCNLMRAAGAGNSVNLSDYMFYEEFFGAVFRFEFFHVRDGDGPAGGYPIGDYAISWGRIEFAVTEPLGYQVDGMYSLMGMNLISMHVSLTTAGQDILFYNTQSSTGFADQVFYVGGQDGTDRNALVGESSGVLMPGQVYSFEYDYRIEASRDDSGASASGRLDFRITPEPGCGILAVWGILVLFARRGCRRGS